MYLWKTTLVPDKGKNKIEKKRIECREIIEMKEE
jgi:hypothetical protein